MKKDFLTGLAILLPAAITFLIAMLIFNFLAIPFTGFVEANLKYLGIFEHPQKLLSKGIALILAVVLIVLFGILGKQMVVRYLISLSNSLFHRIPMVNKIYKAAQDVVQSLLAPDSTGFTKVVLAPFPNRDTLSIGLIPQHEEGILQESISVLILGTPNPLMGFLLSFPKEELIYLDMKVDDALKFVISCGILLPQPEVKA